MQKRYPQQESPKSQEGTAAHEVATDMVLGIEHTVGSLASNGVEVTEEMVEGAYIFQASILDVINEVDSHLKIETLLHAPHIHPDNGGTPDAHWRSGNALHIWDYKFGHRYVEAFENWQMMDYAAAILGDEPPPDVEVTFHIVQPRSYCAEGPVRRWVTNSVDLDPYFEALALAAQAAMGPNPQCVPNEHCGDCSARQACPALQRAALAVADVAYAAVPFDLSDPMIGVELRWLMEAQERLEARISGLSADAESRLRSGRAIPHWQLGASAPREQWTKPIEEVIEMGSLFGKDLKRPPAPITPAQARKAGVPDEILSAYATRPPGAMKLVPVSAVQARKTFNQGA